MKLLTKTETRTAFTDQRKLDIDEGKKLATRVDVLRETLSREEQNLEKFRSETVKTIHQEIKTLNDQKETLRKEVKELAEQRRELLIPLTAAWKEIEIEKENIKNEHERLDKRIQTIESLEERASIHLAGVEHTKKHIELCEEDAVQKFKNAILIEKEAKETLENAEEIKRSANDYALEIKSKIDNEERILTLRQQGFEEKQKMLNSLQKDLADKERQLADREQLLLRNIQRYGERKTRSK